VLGCAGSSLGDLLTGVEGSPARLCEVCVDAIWVFDSLSSAVIDWKKRLEGIVGS